VRFCGLDLATHPGRVMTPRPASEALVSAALEHLDGRPAVVADVGTGSGAVAIGIAAGAPEARVWATDTSPAAIALARKNVSRHGLADRVHVLRGDLLDPVPGAVDLVVANLPYLPSGEPDPELAGEPEAALYAPGDGLGPYRRLLEAAEERLFPSGALIVQFRRRVLLARRGELDALRRLLAERAAA
jgi:release factor glutamine methyltransferase